MKIQKLFTAFLITASSALAHAGMDDIDCEYNNMTKLMGLACISCGIQKHYAAKGQPTIPSEKWLALLAVNARAFRDLNFDGGVHSDDVVRDGTSNENMQKVVISQVQAYGFCSNYLDKDTARSGRSESYRDLSAADWNFLKGFITGAQDRNKSELGEAAKKFGFRTSSGLFGFGGGTEKAYQNMRYMMDDVEFSGAPIGQKRAAFREKVFQALKGKDLVADRGEDKGLRMCLDEVQGHLNNPKSDSESIELCKTMASACDVNARFCTEGFAVVAPPTSTKKSTDSGSKPGKLRPPPPRKSFEGVN